MGSPDCVGARCRAPVVVVSGSYIPHSEFRPALPQPSPLAGEGEGGGVIAVFGENMGRTVLPFSQVLEREYEEWKKFRRALRKEDQEAFDRLFDRAKLHVQAAAYTSHPWPLESILLSICLEHEKLLVEILNKLKETKT